MFPHNCIAYKTDYNYTLLLSYRNTVPITIVTPEGVCSPASALKSSLCLQQLITYPWRTVNHTEMESDLSTTMVLIRSVCACVCAWVIREWVYTPMSLCVASTCQRTTATLKPRNPMRIAMLCVVCLSPKNNWLMCFGCWKQMAFPVHTQTCTLKHRWTLCN